MVRQIVWTQNAKKGLKFSQSGITGTNRFFKVSNNLFHILFQINLSPIFVKKLSSFSTTQRRVVDNYSNYRIIKPIIKNAI